MTDKVQKIRAFLVGIADADGVSTILAKAIEKKILPYIDSLQEEPVSDTQSPVVFYGLTGSVGSTKEEPVNKKKCIFTKDSYTDEDRKVLCEGCKEKFECSKKEEPVSIDFEQELYKAFGQVKDFTLGMQIAKWFYDMGKNSQEPVSEELEEACEQLAENARKHKAETSSPFFSQTDYKQGVIDGAKWQETKDKQVLNEEGVVVLPEEAFERMKRSLIKLAEKEQQMTANAFEGAYIRRNKYTKKNVLNGFDVTCDAIQGFKNGDKVKVILIKEE